MYRYFKRIFYQHIRNNINKHVTAKFNFKNIVKNDMIKLSS